MRFGFSVTALLYASALVAGCRAGSAAPAESVVAAPALSESSMAPPDRFAAERVQAQQLAVESAQVATWVSQAFATGCTESRCRWMHANNLRVTAALRSVCS
jgi:hypothetical protein